MGVEIEEAPEKAAGVDIARNAKAGLCSASFLPFAGAETSVLGGCWGLARTRNGVVAVADRDG